jgi:hypothetical protein
LLFKARRQAIFLREARRKMIFACRIPAANGLLVVIVAVCIVFIPVVVIVMLVMALTVAMTLTVALGYRGAS